MSVNHLTGRPPVMRAARPEAPKAAELAPLKPGDMEGLSADACGRLARDFREQGRADLADSYTMGAVKAAKTGPDALRYATQRHGPEADAPHGMNEYVRSEAPFVASPDVQARAVALAAAKFKSFGAIERALRSHPAQTPEANTLVIKRMVDLAEDSDQVRGVVSLIKLLGSPEAVAYAEAAVKSKDEPSFWTRLDRLIRRL